MTTMHSLLADSVVSAAALVGTLATIAVLRIRTDRNGLTTRFVFALALVSLVLALRLLSWNVHQGIFETLTRAVAAFIPLGALVVLEGLQRRHAPKVIKLIILVGGALFAILAFVSASFVLPLYGLMVFQLVSFTAIYLQAFFGNADLSVGEDSVIGRIRVALPVLVAFLATDYGILENVVPIRASGAAILFFCWMAISSANGTTGRKDAAIAFATTAVLGAIIGLSATVMAEMDWTFAIQLAAMSLCVGILALVINETVTAFAQTRRNDILMALADADTASVDGFIQSVTAGSSLKGSVVLHAPDLTQFDAETLRAAFTSRPVLRQKDLNLLPEEAWQQLESLLITYDATHLMMLSSQPLLMVATTMPSMGRGSGVETELAIVQRMAALVSRSEVGHGTA